MTDNNVIPFSDPSEKKFRPDSELTRHELYQRERNRLNKRNSRARQKQKRTIEHAEFIIAAAETAEAAASTENNVIVSDLRMPVDDMACYSEPSQLTDWYLLDCHFERNSYNR